LSRDAQPVIHALYLQLDAAAHLVEVSGYMFNVEVRIVLRLAGCLGLS
jgi:hypothetical protein